MRFPGVLIRRMSLSTRYKMSNDKAREILGLDFGASQKEIHTNYLKRVKLFHPDSAENRHPESGELMTADEKRKLFDENQSAYNLLMKGESESPEEVDPYDITNSGFPKMASIAYAKHVLGVEPDATEEQIKERYFELSLKYHPDLIDDEDQADLDHFKLITQAYQTFMNQQLVSVDNVYYEDIIPDSAWTVQGREGVYRTRKNEEHEATFFGQDTSTWKFKNYVNKWRNIGAEMREEERNPRQQLSSRNIDKYTE